MKDVQDVINQSIREDRVVLVDASDIDEIALMFACDDHRDLGGDVEDYWGTDNETGAKWRIYVDHGPESGVKEK